MSVKKHRIFILGASSGLGEAVKDHLQSNASDNFEVWGSFNTQKIQDPENRMIALNLNELDSIRSSFGKLAQQSVKFDSLLCCVGKSVLGEQLKTEDQDYISSFQVNFLSIRHVIKYFLPLLSERGKIIVVGSAVSLIQTPWVGSYGLSKKCLRDFCSVLRQELALHDETKNLSLVLLEPGAFKTRIWEKGLSSLSEFSSMPGFLQKLVQAAARRGAQPKSFAIKVKKILNQSNPCSRYVFGPGTFVLRILRLIPQKIVLTFLRIFNSR